MCGIVGVSFSVAKNFPIVQSILSATSSLSHRGPDDTGTFVDAEAGIALGHTRLSILDLSPLGHQPMVSADGMVSLVFNGEIYNFRELRYELETLGHTFVSHSDTEVLLQLYLAEGEAMLPRLNGIFALAVWDSRRGELFIARDALGVKPLYVSVGDGKVSFASEIKAIKKLTPDLGAVDHASLHRYLSFLWCPGNGTPVYGVRKLGPGEALWIKQGKIVRNCTWYQLPTFRPMVNKRSKERAIQGTVRHLRDAVHRQMVADVPVGAFLSGGLDSSSVVAFAKERNPEIQCFTIQADGGEEGGVEADLPYARRVADYLNVSLEIVRIDSVRMASSLEKMVEQLDEPLADPAPLNVFYISQLARERGIKVLLSGAGGDDLFTGYRRHRAVRAEQYWRWLPKSARACLERATSSLNQISPLNRRLAKLFNGAALDGDAKLVNYFLWSRRSDLMALYSAPFKAALADEVAAKPMLDFLAELPKAVTDIDRMLALEQRFFLADHNLIYTDKMSMAAGVEVRVPFLDLELVEFAASIPASFKQRGSVGKWVLKKAMQPYLPKDVIYRPKSGFGAPLRRWMRFELRELLGSLLSRASLSRRGLFDPGSVQNLIAANDAGKIDASYTLLSLLCIEIWCRRFIDPDGSSMQTVY